MIASRLQHFFIAAALLCISSATLAQYAWVDEKGGKHYSDTPPPASVPAKRVRTMSADFTAANTHNESADIKADGDDKTENKTPSTLAEQNAASRKRQDELVEKNKKTEVEAKLATAKTKNCERARAFQRTLDSGVRMAQTDKNGERNFLEDKQREQVSRENKRALSDCKG